MLLNNDKIVFLYENESCWYSMICKKRKSIVVNKLRERAKEMWQFFKFEKLNYQTNSFHRAPKCTFDELPLSGDNVVGDALLLMHPVQQVPSSAQLVRFDQPFPLQRHFVCFQLVHSTYQRQQFTFRFRIQPFRKVLRGKLTV